MCGSHDASCGTYKDLRPAIRGCVAQEPPKTTLCLPSKKSAELVRRKIINVEGSTHLNIQGTGSWAHSPRAFPKRCSSIPKHPPSQTGHAIHCPTLQQKRGASA